MSVTTTTAVRVYGPTSSRTYSTVRGAARALSGNGKDSTERTRSQIRRNLSNGGGYIGRSYVTLG